MHPVIGEAISISSGIEFSMEFYNAKKNSNIDVTFELRNLDEITIFHHGTILSEKNDSKPGVYSVTGVLPPNLLNAGTYKFMVIFGENQRYLLYQTDEIIQFEVLNEVAGSNSNVLPGVIRPQISYQSKFIGVK